MREHESLIVEPFRERTLAITWGPWGGIWLTGKRGLIWRLCLGFVAITYLPAEMTQILDTWMKAEDSVAFVQRVVNICDLLIARRAEVGEPPTWYSGTQIDPERMRSQALSALEGS